jgi:hypothetical protein
MRTLAMPKTVDPRSPTGRRKKQIKIGAEVISHGRGAAFLRRPRCAVLQR